MLKKTLCAVIFFLYKTLHVEQFVYPICPIDQHNYFVLYQHSLDDIDLLIWNKENKVATKALNSSFLPSNVQLLPNKQQFSFIDRGSRIRIKDFQKRAPKTIDMQEPLNSILSMQWISNDQFYMVAKNRLSYGVFLYSLLEHSYEVLTIAYVSDIDFLYPCKVDDLLYVIKRDKNNNYSIVVLPWNPIDYNSDFTHNEISTFFSSKNTLCFLDFFDSHLSFLECVIHKEQDFFEFFYYLSPLNGSLEKLFSFKIPYKHVLGESSSRIYESIKPLLPNFALDKQKVFFTSYDINDNTFKLYEYCLKTATIQEIAVPTISNATYLSLKYFNHEKIPGLIIESSFHRFLLKEDKRTGTIRLDLPQIQ